MRGPTLGHLFRNANLVVVRGGDDDAKRLSDRQHGRAVERREPRVAFAAADASKLTV